MATAHSGNRVDPSVPARFFPVLVVLACAGVVAGVWLFTPLREYLSVEDLAEAADALEHMRFAPLVVLAVYVVGTFLFVPLTLLVAATGAVFGVWPGLAYAFAGALGAALASYGVDTLLGGRRLRRLAGVRVERLTRKVARRGLRAVLAVRLVPVAPFVLVNLAAGASAIRLRDYVIGTALGMAPGVLVKVVFIDQLAQAAGASDEGSLVSVTALGVVLLAASAWIGSILRRRWAHRE